MGLEALVLGGHKDKDRMLSLTCGIWGLGGRKGDKSQGDLREKREKMSNRGGEFYLSVLNACVEMSIMKPTILYSYYILIKSLNLVKASSNYQINERVSHEK